MLYNLLWSIEFGLVKGVAWKKYNSTRWGGVGLFVCHIGLRFHGILLIADDCCLFYSPIHFHVGFSFRWVHFRLANFANNFFRYLFVFQVTSFLFFLIEIEQIQFAGWRRILLKCYNIKYGKFYCFDCYFLFGRSGCVLFWLLSNMA